VASCVWSYPGTPVSFASPGSREGGGWRLKVAIIANTQIFKLATSVQRTDRWIRILNLPKAM
jgi:hypothetical protein